MIATYRAVTVAIPPFLESLPLYAGAVSTGSAPTDWSDQAVLSPTVPQTVGCVNEAIAVVVHAV
jgi:hypothetical protein